ncbi:MAG: 3-ketoacyl-ACP reductase [Planctomycetaceae bacterium]
MSKVALITGGARGIGLGIAQALGSEGYDLMLHGQRPEAEVTDVCNELSRLGVRVVYMAGDLAAHDDRERLVDRTIETFGRIDVLINNAGITSPGRRDILDAREEDFDRVMGVNLKGPFFLTQRVAQQMIAQHTADATARGVVIMISSISAEFVSTNRGDYCLTKQATQMATKLWTVRLAPHGIDVYEIQPGIIKSDMTAAVTEKYDQLIAEGLTHDRRWGTPADIGRAAAALVRGDIPYATGQVLKIDGGMTIREM